LDQLLFIYIGACLLFGYLNGLNDSANVVATVIASRALSARAALAITAAANFLGPFLFGVAVANTIGNQVVASDAVTLASALAALLAAILWGLLAFRLGLPSSSSHALIGGLVGAAVAGHGPGVLQAAGLLKVLLALLISPVLGFSLSWLAIKLLFRFGRDLPPRVNNFFLRAQPFTAAGLGLGQGANDAQKIMGMLTLGLVASGVLAEFSVPTWVVAASAGAMALGTATGGWRTIRTVGAGFYRVRPVHAFFSQALSGTVILGAALLGGPVSTTQVISATVVGAGAAERIKKVRWGLARQILLAWVLTIPITGLLGALGYWLLERVL
jgi:PiT family inorganic phosphate transporter